MPGVSPARSGRSSPRKAGRAEGRSRGSPRSSARAHSQARRHGALAFLGSVAGCFDNALAESVFVTLECELFDQQPGGRFKNRQAKLAVFDYLETFYNPRRRHSASARSAPQRARTLRREPCGKSMSAETRCPRKQVNSRVGIDHEIEFESSMEDLDWLRELGVVMQSARGPCRAWPSGSRVGRSVGAGGITHQGRRSTVCSMRYAPPPTSSPWA